jgi:DNA-binding SARP family transcriptional activator
MMTAEFGSLLRDGRVRAGLTQRDLARAAGISVAAVRDLEQGRSQRPRAVNTTALARALGLPSAQADRLRHAAAAQEPAVAAPPSPVRLSVLGPLSVHRGQVPVVVGGSAQRVVLGLLALGANRPVSRDQLVDALWPDDPPPTAVKLLHTHVARVRRLLRSQVPGRDLPGIRSVPGGYRLDADADGLDLVAYREVVAAAGTATGAARCDLLARALDCWRGEPLADVADLSGYPAVVALRDEQVAVALAYAAAADALGRHADVIARLRELLHRHPLHEPLHAQAVLARCRVGDQAGALRAYEEIRRRLSDELGIDPGPPLRDLHARIVRQQVDIAVHPGPPAVCQLPPDLPDYTGNADAVARIRARLAPGAEQVGAAAPVVVTGSGGTGKTALAVHVAHGMRAAFPDGHLFVSLGGGAPAGPVPPYEAMGRALRALGVADEHPATDLDDQIARYRAALDGRRVLVVLDDAAGVEQVRPFLPGGPGSAVLVSSRVRLTALPGAYHVELDALPEAAAVALLGRIAGTACAGAEPAEVAALARLCARLPLALRIAGARLAARPHWTVSHLVRRMSDEHHRLDELAAGDLAVRSSLAVTYRTLDPPVRWAFRALGALDPPDFAAWTVAALTGTDQRTAEDIVEELVDARLVEVVASGRRYRLHDLVRLYARECAGQDPPAEHAAAMARVLTAALRVAERHTQRLPLAVPRLYRPLLPDDPEPPDGQVPAAWFDAEEATLVAAVERGAALGLHDLACGLAEALVFASFGLRNTFAAWQRGHTAALAAARAAGNRPAEAVIECGLGQLRYKQDRFTEAEVHFRNALARFRADGHSRGEAAALNGIGTLRRELGDHRTAIPFLADALRLLERLGDREGMAHAHYSLGYAHRELGDDAAAVHHLTEAETLYRAAEHQRGQAIAVRGIGLVHRARGELDAAARYSRQAHRMVSVLGDRQLSAYTAQALAKVWIRQGRPEHAREPLATALRTCTDMHDRLGAALVRRTIGELYLAAGQNPAAMRELRAAEAAWRQLGHDLGAARTRRDLGAAYSAGGDCRSAHRAWRAAQRTFDRLGTRESAELPAWRLAWGCRCADSAPTG